MQITHTIRAKSQKYFRQYLIYNIFFIYHKKSIKYINIILYSLSILSLTMYNTLYLNYEKGSNYNLGTSSLDI